jgi:hypothetical protein
MGLVERIYEWVWLREYMNGGGIDFASIWNYSDGVVIPEVFFFILNSFFQLVYLLGVYIQV